MIGCLWTPVHKQPILALYFESETVLGFYKLEAWFLIQEHKTTGNMLFICRPFKSKYSKVFSLEKVDYLLIFDVFYSKYLKVAAESRARTLMTTSELQQLIKDGAPTGVQILDVTYNPKEVRNDSYRELYQK